MRVIIYDAIDKQPASKFWRPGAALYRMLGKADVVYGAVSVVDAFNFLISLGAPTEQIEWWVHARPGMFLIGKDAFTATDMRSTPVQEALTLIGANMAPGAVFWVRGCSPFAGPVGKAFAEELAYRLVAKVAGHTFRIGAFGHSGLHTLAPEKEAPWSSSEGRADEIYGNAYSTPWAPRTVSPLTNKIPKGW